MMDDPRSRQILARFLASEKDDRPYWQTEHRATVMPLVKSGYNDSVSYGVPAILGGHGWSTMSDIVNGRSVSKDELQSAAGDVAGAAMTGAFAAGGVRQARRQPVTNDAPDRNVAPSVLEELGPRDYFGARPSKTQFGVPADLTSSPHWPKSWEHTAPGQKAHDYANAFTREQELRSRWNPIVEGYQYPNGTRAMERWEAEALAMRENADLGRAAQKAAEETDLARHRMAGTKPNSWDAAWHGYDVPPGTPPMSKNELMRKVVAPSVMLPGGVTGEALMRGGVGDLARPHGSIGSGGRDQAVSWLKSVFPEFSGDAAAGVKRIADGESVGKFPNLRYPTPDEIATAQSYAASLDKARRAEMAAAKERWGATERQVSIDGFVENDTRRVQVLPDEYPVIPAARLDGKIRVGPAHHQIPGISPDDLEVSAASFNKLPIDYGFLTNKGGFTDRFRGAAMLGRDGRELESTWLADWRAANQLPGYREVMHRRANGFPLFQAGVPMFWDQNEQ